VAGPLVVTAWGGGVRRDRSRPADGVHGLLPAVEIGSAAISVAAFPPKASLLVDPPPHAASTSEAAARRATTVRRDNETAAAISKGPSQMGNRAASVEILVAVMDPELVNFDDPTEGRSFEKGKFELYEVGPTTLGRATYEPGWRSSEHVGKPTGDVACRVEHVGLLLSGEALAARAEGVTVLSLIVAKDGSVRDLKIVQSSGNAALDDASILCVRDFRYRPATEGGEPVEVVLKVQSVWRLKFDGGRTGR